MQKLFKFKDGEKVIAAFSLDPRIAKKIEAKKEGDIPPVHAVTVATTTGEETVIAATSAARAMRCPVEEVNFLSGPGRGIILIKSDFHEDKVIGARSRSADCGNVAGSGADDRTTKYEIVGRGGKGRELMQRGQFTRVVPNEVALPTLETT